MTARISFVACNVLFLVLALAGAWTWWEENSPRDAWTLDEPMRTLTDFTPREKMATSFRLRNTSRVPLQILGASTC